MKIIVTHISLPDLSPEQKWVTHGDSYQEALLFFGLMQMQINEENLAV